MKTRTALPRTAALLLALAGAGIAPAVQAAESWHLHAGGVSKHMEQTGAPGREWNEAHPGLGLEVRQANGDGWSRRNTLGVMQDSRKFWGGYAGMAAMREWRLGGVAEVSVGAGAYVFYRSRSWNGTMGLVPGVLPTASITLPGTNTGINLLYVPRISAYGKAMPSVVYLQMTVPLP